MNWLVRSAIVMLYPRTAELPGAADCDIDAFLVKLRRDSTLVMWAGIVLGAVVFHLTPLLTVYVPLPAFLLPAKLADTHAHKISGSSLYYVRQAVFLVKLPAGLLWGGHPEVRKRLALPVYQADPGTWRSS